MVKKKSKAAQPVKKPLMPSAKKQPAAAKVAPAPAPKVSAPPVAPTDAASILAAETAKVLLQDERLTKVAEVLGVTPEAFAEAIVHSAIYPDADPKRLSPSKTNGKPPFSAAELATLVQKAVAELRTTEPFLAARKCQLQLTQAKAGDSRVADPKLEVELSKKLRFGARGPMGTL